MGKHAALDNVNIVDVVSSRLHLTKNGSEHVGICPFHDDHVGSLKVNERKQIYSCFACGANGDAINFLMRHGLDFKEALSDLNNTAGIYNDVEKRKSYKAPKKVIWTDAIPSSLPVSFSHYRHGEPSHKWSYKNKDGITIGYACRFDLQDGSKEVLPFTYRTNGTTNAWRWEGFDTPRPLYGLDLLNKYPEKTVIIVEGEKTADAVNKSIDNAIAITWPGGAKAISKIDFSPIINRRKIYWPDHDDAGISAMINISMIAGDGFFINIPKTYPAKWDAADKEWNPGEINLFLNEFMSDGIPPPDVPSWANKTEMIWMHESNYSSWDNGVFSFKKKPIEKTDLKMEPIKNISKKNNDPFQFLGFEKNAEDKLVYVFFVNAANQVLKYTAGSLTKNTLMTLAPINWWEEAFPQKTSFNLEGAVNWIIQTSQKSGIYEPKKIRGLGAWMECDMPVIHSGTHLIVGGIKREFSQHDSAFIYEAKHSLAFHIDNPMDAKSSAKIIDMLKLVKWEREVSAHLLAGWCVIAPVCGALKWRPHIWITGGAGTGKSWIMQSVVRKMLGECAMAVQGETTEAGIRQYLGADARPIVFDEAEGEDRRAVDRIQNVLALMRGSSTDDGGSIIKGSAGGKSQEFIIRSCFAFASIGMQVSQQSDRSRVTVLSIKGEQDRLTASDDWKKIQEIASMITPEYCAGIRARTLILLPIIIKNAEIFSEAAALELGSQRLGDQLGALLAGAYSLTSQHLITLPKAIEWIKARSIQWDEERGLENTKDEIQLLSLIMEHIVRVEPKGYTAMDRTIGELIRIACGDEIDLRVDMTEAQDKLRRMGIKIEDKFIVISNSASGIKGILANTTWSRNHGKILKRISGAIDIASARFGTAMSSRAVGIPLSLIVE